MTTFTVTGILANVERAVTWTDGHLSGDDAAVATVEGVVAAGSPVGLAGLYSGPPSLGEHGPALATVIAAFDGSAVATGDAPAWEDVPDGAIP